MKVVSLYSGADNLGDFKFAGNKGSVKRQIGNAVPAAIGKAFFEGVKI